MFFVKKLTKLFQSKLVELLKDFLLLSSSFNFSQDLCDVKTKTVGQ